MKQEQKRQIQEAVLNSMAPANAGQVSLEDVARAFTGRGSIEEIEECLNELAKQGFAEKTTVTGRTHYVFQSIAGEAASGNEKRLVEIQKELENLSREEETGRDPERIGEPFKGRGGYRTVAEPGEGRARPSQTDMAQRA